MSKIIIIIIRNHDHYIFIQIQNYYSYFSNSKMLYLSVISEIVIVLIQFQNYYIFQFFNFSMASKIIIVLVQFQNYYSSQLFKIIVVHIHNIYSSEPYLKFLFHHTVIKVIFKIIIILNHIKNYYFNVHSKLL